MVKFIITNREVFNASFFNKGTVGKIDFELLKSKLPFDIEFLKGNHLPDPLKRRLVNEDSVKLFKKTIQMLDDHYCLAVEGSDNFTYIAIFTKSLKNKLDPVMLKYNFMTNTVGQGHPNIEGFDNSIQHLVVNPFYQFNSDWIKFLPLRWDNIKGSNYYSMHGREIDWTFYSAYKNPLNSCLNSHEIISDVHEIVLKIASMSNNIS